MNIYSYFIFDIFNCNFGLFHFFVKEGDPIKLEINKINLLSLDNMIKTLHIKRPLSKVYILSFFSLSFFQITANRLQTYNIRINNYSIYKPCFITFFLVRNLYSYNSKTIIWLLLNVEGSSRNTGRHATRPDRNTRRPSTGPGRSTWLLPCGVRSHARRAQHA